uniref:Uncharacterized protein n=1 Tax=Steinernema glaseri TaxID=37863 RepID=A0A1I7Z2R8_9BILA
MWTAFLLLLCFVGLHAQDGRTFKDAKLTLHIHQVTSECGESGTDCDLTTSFGFTDAHHRLRYVIRTPPQKGNVGRRFELATRHQFSHNLPDAEFRKIEQTCADLATNSSGFHYPTYDGCFNMNIIYLESYTWWGNTGADWKAEVITAILQFTFRDGSVSRRVVNFVPLLSCGADWVQGGGRHFLCSGKEKRPARAYLPKSSTFQVGDVLVCPW